MMRISDNRIPDFGKMTDTRALGAELENYLRGLQEKLDYVLTHIGDGNINFRDISALAERIRSEGGGADASDT